MNLTSDFESGRLTLYFSGELDHHQARDLMRQINDVLDELLPRECVVDLSSLRFMDSSGIAVIVRLSQRMKELGGRLWLEKPLGQPKRVIETAGIDRLAPVAITR